MNPQNENKTDSQNPYIPSASSASSADSALNLGNRPSVGRPLTRLLCLSERQLEHVNAWLKEGVPCRKIVDLCLTEFQKEIPYMTFVRYSNRTDLFRQLDGLTDSQEAAAELSRYAATGDPSFSKSTLELLEQQAFDLALAYNRDADADDLSKLERLWTLIHKAKGTSIRERHATVQEQKIALRREELEFKRQLATTRLPSNNGGTRSPSPTSFPHDAINPTQAAPADPNNQINPPETLSVSSVPPPSVPSVSLPILPSEFSADSALKSVSKPSNLPFHRIPGPCPLPDEIVTINRASAIELLSGHIDVDTDEPTTPTVLQSHAQQITALQSTQTTGGLQ